MVPVLWEMAVQPSVERPSVISVRTFRARMERKGWWEPVAMPAGLLYIGRCNMGLSYRLRKLAAGL